MMEIQLPPAPFDFRIPFACSGSLLSSTTTPIPAPTAIPSAVPFQTPLLTLDLSEWFQNLEFTVATVPPQPETEATPSNPLQIQNSVAPSISIEPSSSSLGSTTDGLLKRKETNHKARQNYNKRQKLRLIEADELQQQVQLLQAELEQSKRSLAEQKTRIRELELKLDAVTELKNSHIESLMLRGCRTSYPLPDSVNLIDSIHQLLLNINTLFHLFPHNSVI
jgi:hypothetical protein